MNRAELQQAIQCYRWYHSIPLCDGMFTPGKRSYEHLTSKLRMMQLPQDLSGRSVLDIGCNEGFYAIEASVRGAARVLGIDNEQRKDVAKKFSLVKEALEHKAEFRFMDVCDLDSEAIGSFDIVFFLSVMHHLRYPTLALDKVAAVTKGYAIIEVVVIDSDSGADNCTLVRGLGNKGKVLMFPNRQFLTEMIESAGFKHIEVLGSHSRRRYNNTPAECGKVLLKAYK